MRSEIRRHSALDSRKLVRRLRRLQGQVRELRALARRSQSSLTRLQRRVRGLRRAGDSPLRRGTGMPGRPLTPQSIRMLRGKLGMTREQFAKALEVSPGAVFLWESGRSRPRNQSIVRIREIRRARLGARSAASGESTRRRLVRRRAPRRRTA